MSESKIKEALAAIKQEKMSQFKTASEYKQFCDDFEAQAKVGRGWKGRLNLYICMSCGATTISRDIDNGVTPFGYMCKEECGGHAQSIAYAIREPEFVKAREEQQWYRPSHTEYLMLPPDAVQHVNRGGLLPRKAIHNEEDNGTDGNAGT